MNDLYLTIVFKADSMGEEERSSLVEKCSAASWSHAIDERNALEADVERLTAEVESLQKHNEFLNGELKRSRLDERQAMTYLSQVRIAAGFDGDFPSLLEHVKQMAEALRAAHEMTKAAWMDGSDAGWKAANGELLTVEIVNYEKL